MNMPLEGGASISDPLVSWIPMGSHTSVLLTFHWGKPGEYLRLRWDVGAEVVEFLSGCCGASWTFSRKLRRFACRCGHTLSVTMETMMFQGNVRNEPPHAPPPLEHWVSLVVDPLTAPLVVGPLQEWFQEAFTIARDLADSDLKTSMAAVAHLFS